MKKILYSVVVLVAVAVLFSFAEDFAAFDESGAFALIEPASQSPPTSETPAIDHPGNGIAPSREFQLVGAVWEREADSAPLVVPRKVGTVHPAFSEPPDRVDI